VNNQRPNQAMKRTADRCTLYFWHDFHILIWSRCSHTPGPPVYVVAWQATPFTPSDTR
jgi:hypothetical protein